MRRQCLMLRHQFHSHLVMPEHQMPRHFWVYFWGLMPWHHTTSKTKFHDWKTLTAREKFDLYCDLDSTKGVPSNAMSIDGKSLLDLSFPQRCQHDAK